MKKTLSAFLLCVFLPTCLSWGAVNVKKAAPVATKQADKMESATSLLPNVIGLVGSVTQLKAQQQQLTAECAPTSAEVDLVNDLIKEWAKIGDTDSVTLGNGVVICNPNYQFYMENLAEKDTDVCYSKFNDNSDYIWGGYLMASRAEICPDGNKKNCKTVSNVYELFQKIPFTDEDYTISERERIANFRTKYEKCALSRVNAAKRELYGGFLTQTLGSIGQTTGAADTASIMNAVSSMGGSSNIGSMIPSLGQMATQMLDK